jgi:hypothetical protein
MESTSMADSDIVTSLLESSRELWREAETSTSEQVVWRPLVAFDEGKKWLGMAEDAGWYWSSNKDGSSGLHPLVGPEGVGSLPILESSPQGVIDRLAEELGDIAWRRRDLGALLPLERLTELALQTHSDYWVERSLDWIDVFGTDRVGDQLPAAAMDRRLSQGIRHRLQRAVPR